MGHTSVFPIAENEVAAVVVLFSQQKKVRVKTLLSPRKHALNLCINQTRLVVVVSLIFVVYIGVLFLHFTQKLLRVVRADTLELMRLTYIVVHLLIGIGVIYAELDAARYELVDGALTTAKAVVHMLE